MTTSATMGVMNPLLDKLTNLLSEEYRMLTGVRKQASFLKDELSAMKALLDKKELMDELDPSTKNWRDHIREMSYDMENCIDDFIHNIEGAVAKKGFVRKMAQRLRRLGRRHQIASRIEELKVLAMEASARREGTILMLASIRVLALWLWILGSQRSTRRQQALSVLMAREKSW
ncbi:hypothetical protein VPH35_108193 [Triticum aestivum]